MLLINLGYKANLMNLSQMTRHLDTFPHPWTYANLEEAIFKSFSDALEAIEDTEGGRLWRSLKELEDSVYVLEANITDLLDEISLFADRSKNSSFWHQAGGSEAERHTRAVKRKLSNCTASLMALVEHARAFQGKFPVDGYADELRNNFSTPGLHKFLQDLRNYNIHWRMAQTNWVISSGSEATSRHARFVVHKSELLAWDKWTKEAKKYIEAMDDSLDVYEAFSTYRTHVQKFYTWHQGEFCRKNSAELRQYLEYKRLYEGINKKSFWNMAISHFPKAQNPFKYLPQYLSTEAVERVLALPYQSKEQVDEIIRQLDMDQFCDDSLREKVYALFNATK